MGIAGMDKCLSLRNSSGMSPVACCIGCWTMHPRVAGLSSCPFPCPLRSPHNSAPCLHAFVSESTFRGSLGQDTTQTSPPQEGLQWPPDKSDLCYLFPLLYAPNFYFLEYYYELNYISPLSLYVDMLIPSTSEWLYMDIEPLKQWLKQNDVI